MCKRAFRLRDAEEVPPVLAQSIRLAREGEPGPVLVEIPLSAQHQQAHLEGTGFRTIPRALSAEAMDKLEQIALWIDSAQSVALHAGAGCQNALTELEELSERLCAPVSTTISGMGTLPYIHPMCVGFGPGAAGSPVAEDAFGESDLVLAIGCKSCMLSPDMLGTRVGARVAIIDIEPTSGDSPRLLTVGASAKQALRYLLDRVAEKPNPSMREKIRVAKRRLRKSLGERAAWTDAVDPVNFFSQLRELLSADDYLVLDSGRHAVFAIAVYPVHSARTLLAPVDFRAAGFSVPAAVAVKLARPENRVVACVGDGGFLRTGVELLTARRCDVAPVVVVFADRELGEEMEGDTTMLSRATAVNLMPVDYEGMARSLGVSYLCIRNDNELEDGLTQAVTMDRPVLVELRVAYREASTSLKVSHREDLTGTARSSALLTGARWILRKLLKDEV
jgi:acetolactate synthase-1/2/3 large subunit